MAVSRARPPLYHVAPGAPLPAYDKTPASDWQYRYDRLNQNRQIDPESGNYHLDLWTDTDLTDIRQQVCDPYILSGHRIKTVNDKYISHVTLPFFYWKSPSLELSKEEYRDRLCNDRPPADITGRIVIQLHNQVDPVSNWHAMHKSTKNVTDFLSEREAHFSWPFKIFVPFSTRTASSTLESFFPVSVHQYRHHLKKHESDGTIGVYVWQVGAAIADLVTLPFKFLSLIPRIIYQHGIQNSRNIEGLQDIQVHVVSGAREEFSWNQGLFLLDIISSVECKRIVNADDEVIGVTNEESRINKCRQVFVFGG